MLVRTLQAEKNKVALHPHDFTVYQAPGTWCLYTSQGLYTIRGGLRHGGLMPALAPRTPVIPEDVGKSRRYM